MHIEQSEPKALAGFDIQRFNSELVCIEAFRTTRDAISRYFETNGYKRIDKYLEHDSANWYFTPAEIHETISMWILRAALRILALGETMPNTRWGHPERRASYVIAPGV
jgi:hypothetical protein